MTERRYFPLTYPQKPIWHIERFYPNTSYANVSGYVLIKQNVRLDLLAKAINRVIDQNHALRIRLVKTGKEPMQYVSDYQEQQFDQLDFDYPGGSENLSSWSEGEAAIPFGDLFERNLFHFVLIKRSTQEGGFFMKLHHLISDAWSATIIVTKILEAYSDLVSGNLLNKDHPSYIDFILKDQEYLNSPKFKERETFWKSKFETMPELTTFKKREFATSTKAKRKSFHLSHQLTSDLNTYCQATNISPFLLFYSLLAVYLARVTSKNDIVIGTYVLNRTNFKEKHTLGMFISNIPFRTFVDHNLELSAYLQMLSKEWKQLLKNQQYPHYLILKNYRDTHKTSDKLIDVTLSYQSGKYNIKDLDFTAKWHFNGSEINSLIIHISDREGEGALVLDFDYLVEVFTETEIEQIHHHLLNLLQDVLQHPTKKLSELELLSPPDKKTLLEEFNATQREYPHDQTIQQLFEEQAQLNPQAVALVFGDQQLTYKELNERSNQLARVLREKGVKKGTLVGLMLRRSLEMMIGILGILKAGGAYLPLDPDYPQARIRYMFEDSSTRLLLTQRDLAPRVTHLSDHLEGVSVLHLDQAELYAGDGSNLGSINTPSDLAYVIYTSGSTGNPKGVMIEHKALINFVHVIPDLIDFSPHKTIVSLATVSFDIFIVETLLPLVRGLKVVLTSEEEQKTPRLLFELIDRWQVDILQATPSRMQAILKEKSGLDSLKRLSDLIITAEPFPEPLLTELNKHTQAKIYNMYGPTETTVWATFLEATNSKKITIGKPIGNTQIYILDEHFNPVPNGVVGEIYIGGDGLARGYLHKADLTREKFLPNPFKAEARLYKTGDLGRWLPEGQIECLGRNDHQVKIRGFRIELGEIEACLLNHDLIQEAVVLSQEDPDGRRYLCAYLAGANQIETSELRKTLSLHLPDYMIPSRFIWLEALPLSPNGKIDRQALPEPGTFIPTSDTPYQAPSNWIEEKLALLWAEILEAEKVGLDDNFFTLGGDSLHIIEILTDVFPLGWNLKAQDFYLYPTIRELAAKIQGENRLAGTSDTSRTAGITTAERRELKYSIPNRLQLDTREEEAGIKESNLKVLLTGATGFLGIHILKELLETTKGRIYALIRGQEGRRRLLELIDFYFPEHAENLSRLLASRVSIVNGDIAQENFGLEAETYQELARNVDTVIHAAANVKHYGYYAEFEKVNVQGTHEVIDFCINYGKRLNHISTMSICGNYLVEAEKNATFSEHDFFIGQNFEDNVYVRSKFEAESAVFNAMNSGLTASIFRIGVLTGRYSDGHFQQNIEENAFYNKLHSFLRLGVIPDYLLNQDLEFTPVDYCAQGIVKIVSLNRAGGRVFHMFNHHTIPMYDFLNILNPLGFNINWLAREPFYRFIEDFAKRTTGKDVLKWLVTDFSMEKELNLRSSVQIQSEITQTYLKKIGFEWPEINSEYLEKVLSYMRKVNFLNYPGQSGNLISLGTFK